MAQKYTITNPNLLVEELEGDLTMKVNVKGELKELVNTGTTNSILEILERFEECCENPPTPPIPTGDGVNVIELGFGDWWHYRLDFHGELKVKIQVQSLYPEFVFGEAEIEENEQNPYNIRNIQLNYSDEIVSLSFTATVNNVDVTCEYSSNDKFMEGKFINNGEYGPDTLNYWLYNVDLNVSGEYDDTKVNFSRFVYNTQIEQQEMVIDTYSTVIRQDVGDLGKMYASYYDLTKSFNTTFSCIFGYEGERSISEILFLKTYEQEIDELRNDILSTELQWKGKVSWLGNVSQPYQGQSLYAIQDSFFEEDSFHLGRRSYREGSFCIITSDTEDYIQISFSDDTGSYNILIQYNKGVTTLDFNNIEDQLTGFWKIVGSNDANRMNDDSLTFSFDYQTNYIKCTVPVRFSSMIPEYDNNDYCYYTISIFNGFTISNETPYTVDDINVDYDYYDSAHCEVMGGSIQHQPVRYFIPGLQL